MSREATPAAQLTRLAAIFYGLLAAASLAALLLRGHAHVLRADPQAPLARFGLAGDLALDAAIGLLLGLAIAAAGQAAGDLRALRALSERLRELLRGLTPAQALLLALFSGAGEELLFRGAMFEELLPRLGPAWTLVATSLLFAAAHVGRDRRLLVWTALSLAIGFLLGGLRLLTGSLVAPITLHVTVNGLNLLLESWETPSAPPPAGGSRDAPAG